VALDLSQICPEALALFGERDIPHATANCIGRMKPAHQVKVAELMVSVNNLTVPFAKALLLASPSDQLKKPARKKPVYRIKESEQKALQRQVAALHTELRSVQDDYRQFIHGEIIAMGYAKLLIRNERVADYLHRHHPEAYEAISDRC